MMGKFHSIPIHNGPSHRREHCPKYLLPVSWVSLSHAIKQWSQHWASSLKLSGFHSMERMLGLPVSQVGNQHRLAPLELPVDPSERGRREWGRQEQGFALDSFQ